MFRIQRLVRPRASSVAAATLTIAVACAALGARAQVASPASTPPAATQALALDFDSCARPQWPAESLRNGEQGTVRIELLIGTDGQVKDSRIAKSAGFRDLDKAALTAISACRTKIAPAEDTWLPVSYEWTSGPGVQPLASVSHLPGTVDFSTCPHPAYPPAAIREKRQGKVRMKFLVGADGRVTDSAIVDSSGSTDLDEAALTAISQCRFHPPVRDGQAVADWRPVEYVWTLE